MSTEIGLEGEFDVFLSKPDFKFSCAHFIAFKGFREKLHGHNYQVSVRVTGGHTSELERSGEEDGLVPGLGADGYLIDFGEIKRVARELCREMNEYFLCPELSDVLTITCQSSPSDAAPETVCISCEDGSVFSMPRGDVKMLPVYHSSAEEMARYLYIQIVSRLGLKHLKRRGVRLLSVGVAEAAGQEAVFRRPVPRDDAELEAFRSERSARRPKPCLA